MSTRISAVPTAPYRIGELRLMETAEVRKVCFISGSGSGNGRGMALRMAELGYDMALHHSGRDPVSMEAIRSQIEVMGRRAEVFTEDLSKPGSAHRLFDHFREKFDRLDIFVANAGVTRSAPILKMREETFDEVCAIDWKSSVFCVQEAGRFMKEKGIRGSVVLISSNHSRRMWAGSSAYGSMKAALRRFTEYAAVEFAPFGIRVNCLAPGYINREYDHTPEQERNFFADIPLKRRVRSSELGDWTAFLASETAASVKGVTIDIDGGARLLNDSLDKYGL
jgi:NAD(P)-dependent dehydrogenase (short-subunit alcohol dehydrogenase family)